MVCRPMSCSTLKISLMILTTNTSSKIVTLGSTKSFFGWTIVLVNLSLNIFLATLCNMLKTKALTSSLTISLSSMARYQFEHYIFQPFFAQPSPTDTPVNPHPFYACPCPLFLRTPVMVKPRLPRHTWTFSTVMKSTNTSPLLSLLSSCKQTERLLSRVMGVYMLLLADFLNFIGMGRYANTTT